MRLARLAFSLLAALAAALPLTEAGAQSRSPRALASLLDPAYSHVPGEMLVQYRRGVSDSDKERAIRRVGGVFVDEVARGSARFDGGDLELLRLPPGLSVAAAMRDVETDPAVEFAEPNWIYRHTATSNDPYFTNGSLWGMLPTNQYGSQAAKAWANEHTCSSTVYVGVIDEGIMIGHPDLAPNIWTNPREIPGNGVDDDLNGYVDDVNGWDFAGNDNTVYDGTQDDHGTHVTGTIGAVGGNGAGVAGLCWNVKIISAKFLGRNGGTTANAIKAIDYLNDLKVRQGLNLVATNNSWGGGGFSQALKDAIDRAGAANILFVAAAGNSSVNNDASPHYPSSYTSANIISVASITASGALSSFSNYGATSVDLGAPGSGIWSTVPSRKGASYASYSGTSMATPHVTGAAAMYAASHSSAPAAEIKAAILGSVVPTPSLAGKTLTGGRLNVSGF
ncbi:MAG TPA: S8 family peptidase [Burkholderiaceae bacterium]|nr:S8 family peptidase [Burkholderiaceae bacterium]